MERKKFFVADGSEWRKKGQDKNRMQLALLANESECIQSKICSQLGLCKSLGTRKIELGSTHQRNSFKNELSLKVIELI